MWIVNVFFVLLRIMLLLNEIGLGGVGVLFGLFGIILFLLGVGGIGVLFDLLLGGVGGSGELLWWWWLLLLFSFIMVKVVINAAAFVESYGIRFCLIKGEYLEGKCLSFFGLSFFGFVG